MIIVKATGPQFCLGACCFWIVMIRLDFAVLVVLVGVVAAMPGDAVLVMLVCVMASVLGFDSTIDFSAFFSGKGAEGFFRDSECHGNSPFRIDP